MHTYRIRTHTLLDVLLTYVNKATGISGASRALVVKDPPALGSVSGLGKSSGGEEMAAQYSCQENPTDRRVWLATVHGVANSRT